MSCQSGASTYETAMGVKLFDRSNNAIRLTDTGESFFRQAVTGLNALGRAIEMTMRDGRDLSVLVSTSLAIRWLIPRLDGFRKRFPDISVRIETANDIDPAQTAGSDLSLLYLPAGTPLEGREVLLEDRCRPYLSPALLERKRNGTGLGDIPALQCTSSNWDWQMWLKATGKTDVRLTYGGHFDLDDAALRAAIAGLGMVLSSQFMIRDDLEANRLCPLPGSDEVLLGYFTLEASTPVTGATRAFANWLRALR